MDVVSAALAAIAAGPRDSDRFLRLHSPFGPGVLVAETFQGAESLDHGGFRFDLTALSTNAHLDLAELLGQPVLLELQAAETLSERRPFHGHVTAAERVGSNGGLARYRLVIEPWLGFLGQRLDQYVFQDLTTPEIVESVFADYADAGRLVPAWRWDLKDTAVYRKRSLCTQFEETDLAFVERLLAEEGIHYHFEHEGDPSSGSFGKHTLVLADHNDAFADLGPVRFHRSDATERSDSIQQWSRKVAWQPQSLRRSSWDYRRLDTRAVEAGGSDGAIGVTDEDILEPYAYPDRATGERLVQRRDEALKVTGLTISGQGSWRRLRAGARIELVQHPQGGRFVCLRSHHRARNNLGADILAHVEQVLGRATLPALPLPAAINPYTDGDAASDDAAMPCTNAASDAALASGPVGGYFYDNAFFGIPEERTYRPRYANGFGEALRPKPVVRGTQSAIVVTDGGPIQTDRDHRIKVQFPWQRGGNASSHQSHPAGDDNAPADAGSWTWVRVSAAWAGDNWGSVLLPRRGQEVLVAFLEGDIDRPVVVGSVYNGAGQADAPHNQVAGGAVHATGNAPAWFDGNDHNAVFTGFKSQELAASQTGSGGYQQLRLDDTPGQGRAQASTTQHATTLTLGHLKGGRDNVRGGERGFGIELSTQASGAIRAGAGLLLSTEPGRQQLDAGGGQAQLAQGQQLIASLNGAAKAQGADLPGEADTLQVDASLATLGGHLAATHTASASGAGIGGGDGQAPAWTAPALLATSPDGIAAVTPADNVWVSGEQTGLTAGSDLQWLSQGATVIAAQNGIALYTHGSDSPAGKPNTDTGIALHAVQGTVSARAPSATAQVAAQVSVTIASTAADVQIAAPNKHLLAAAAGSYIKLEGGDIELGAPGTIEFLAAKKEWASGQGASGPAPKLTKGELKLCEFRARGADSAGEAAVPLGG
ncbi:type VI secretion system tip protein TssI/VgrG [Lysobacter sp. F60174L2]|uniref:type VI secretion system tip protein TssI/VgrG n=1 Tax=Lysobacter sp. F60174L2 TaxID=3459295 RepID=UPI00403D6B27